MPPTYTQATIPIDALINLFRRKPTQEEYEQEAYPDQLGWVERIRKFAGETPPNEQSDLALGKAYGAATRVKGQPSSLFPPVKTTPEVRAQDEFSGPQGFRMEPPTSNVRDILGAHHVEEGDKERIALQGKVDAAKHVIKQQYPNIGEEELNVAAMNTVFSGMKSPEYTKALTQFVEWKRRSGAKATPQEAVDWIYQNIKSPAAAQTLASEVWKEHGAEFGQEKFKMGIEERMREFRERLDESIKKGNISHQDRQQALDLRKQLHEEGKTKKEDDKEKKQEGILRKNLDRIYAQAASSLKSFQDKITNPQSHHTPSNWFGREGYKKGQIPTFDDWWNSEYADRTKQELSAITGLTFPKKGEVTTDRSTRFPRREEVEKMLGLGPVNLKGGTARPTSGNSKSPPTKPISMMSDEELLKALSGTPRGE